MMDTFGFILMLKPTHDQREVFFSIVINFKTILIIYWFSDIM